MGLDWKTGDVPLCLLARLVHKSSMFASGSDLTSNTEWNNVAPEMDVILCPAFPTPAPLHDTSRYWGYTSLFNLLDYSALVFPVTKVDPERDAKDITYTPKNEFDSWAYEHYDPVKQKDAPVSLQLVAKKLEEEKLLQAFREIQEKVGLPFVNCLA